MSIVVILKIVFSFLAVLGIVVLVHEFGHYIAARLMGVRIEIFSFGFGKRLFGKKIGETDFRLSLIPLGGFVKMSGEEDYDRDPRDLKPYDFLAKNRGQKIFILVMGPIMNLVLAFFLYTTINIVGIEIEKYRMEPPRIGYVQKGSPAEKAGIKPRDLILTINDREIETWQNLHFTIGTSANETLNVEYERDGKRMHTSIEVKAATRYSVGYAGLSWDFRTVLGKIKKDSPASRADIKDGDIVLAIDGNPLVYYDFTDVIGASAGKPLSFKIKRGEEIFTRQITPQLVYYLLDKKALKSEAEAEERLEVIKKNFPELKFSVMGKTGAYKVYSEEIYSEAETHKYRDIFEVKDRGIIGVGEWLAYSPTIKIRYGLWDAMVKSKNDIGELSFFIFNFLKKIVRGKVSAGQLSGPIEIAKFSQKAMERGASEFFILIAFISLQLGILNLLPIPALDGGHLMIYSIETIIRKDFSAKVKTILLNTGFLILISLMVFVILNDIAKNLPHGWNTFWPF